jgi:hypothetical protein
MFAKVVETPGPLQEIRKERKENAETAKRISLAF